MINALGCAIKIVEVFIKKIMLGKIKELLNTKHAASFFMMLAIFFVVKVVVYVAAIISLPVFLYFIKTAYTISNNEEFYQFFKNTALKYFSEDGDNFKIESAIFFLILFKVSLVTAIFVCVFFIQFIFCFIVFKSIKKYFTFRDFYLESTKGLKGEIKFIALWIFLYGLCTFLTKISGFESKLYMQLVYFYQAGIFYLLINKGCFGCKIKKRSRSIKR